MGQAVSFLPCDENHDANSVYGRRDRLERADSSAASRCIRRMKSLGRETELVVYPDEYHEFKTPSHMKDRLERQLAWLRTLR